ncbi:hypothetical protein [Tumebacillus flagellatus]|uniref:Uncharacterized protein n=1 Tax=Tumebacillus flagellatus TaxID=1157490 RepID=A0A074LR56_9BACL|nr:hypothetical protein [Tumebacillus flagellatus]KEO82980.1 hypothetical protein EL26_12855 [Tumebacillus flagellatus]
MRVPYVDERDEKLMEWCREVARICVSDEFKRLNRDLLKFYRKSGMDDPFLLAFQDSLFSLFTEGDENFQQSFEYN